MLAYFYFLPQALEGMIRRFVEKLFVVSWVYHAASWHVSQARNFRKTGSYNVRFTALYCTLILEVYAWDCKRRFLEWDIMGTNPEKKVGLPYPWSSRLHS